VSIVSAAQVVSYTEDLERQKQTSQSFTQTERTHTGVAYVESKLPNRCYAARSSGQRDVTLLLTISAYEQQKMTHSAEPVCNAWKESKGMLNALKKDDESDMSS